MADFWPPPADTLEPTWFINDREPDMDDIYERAGDSLKKMVDKLQMHPFQDTDGKPRLFLARYEFPKDQEQFQHPDGVFVEEALGFIDFLAGFPMECIEMLGIMGEFSTKKDDFEVLPGGGQGASPVPDTLFAGMPEERILLTKLFLAKKGQGLVMKEGEGFVHLEGESKPQKLHWWVRTNIKKEAKFPVPGEFTGLVVRMMPDMPWGKQLSSPFIFSGNWMDTVYYSSARVKEVIEPDDEIPYPRYKVQWRKDVVEATPSDFAEYQVEDRVTILKAVDVDKKSQTWKDDDVKEFPPDQKWIIAPITFYDDLGKEE